MSLLEMWERADENSALRRRFPTRLDLKRANSADVRERIAYEDRHPRNAKDNTGFPDDWPEASSISELFDKPKPELEEIEANVATAWDLGVSLPSGHPFAPVVDGRQAA